jgi:predicted RNA-binding Zn-ribbon protein involved in translation (DUF1610 family)
MHEPTLPDTDPSPATDFGAGTAPRSRTCPSCGTALDHTGNGSDQVLECPKCGLVMFDQRNRPQSG